MEKNGKEKEEKQLLTFLFVVVTLLMEKVVGKFKKVGMRSLIH